MGVVIKNVRNYLLGKERRERFLKQKERDSIISMLKALDFIWEKYGVKKVYVYGSVGALMFHRYSDIDIAIEPEIAYEKLLQLFSEVNRHVEREVDLRLLAELPFADKVKKEGIIIYERANSHS